MSRKMTTITAAALVLMCMLASSLAFAAPASAAEDLSKYGESGDDPGPAITASDSANGEITFYWDKGEDDDLQTIALWEEGRPDPVRLEETSDGFYTFTGLRRDARHMAAVTKKGHRFGHAGFAAAGYIPTGVTAAATNGRINIEWDDMQADRYQVNLHREDGSVAAVHTPTGTGTHFKNLTNGANYSMAVRADRDGKWSQWSPRVAVTPLASVTSAIELGDPQNGDNCNHFVGGTDAGFDFITRIWKGQDFVDEVEIHVIDDNRRSDRSTKVHGIDGAPQGDGVYLHRRSIGDSTTDPDEQWFFQPPDESFEAHQFVTSAGVDGVVASQKVEVWHYWAPGGEDPTTFYMPYSRCANSKDHNCRAGH